MINPFVISGYRGPEYFCDRVEETRKLCEDIRNGANVTLLAPRRYGKTGLIHNVFSRLTEEHEYQTIYIDIFGTKNLAEFVDLFARSVLGKLDTPFEKLQGAAKHLMQAARGSISYDAQTGQPTITFGLATGTDSVHTLEQIFDYLKERNCPTVIAIDEFQQVREYPEHDVEAILRSHIQFCPAQFIFSDSKQHIIRDIFISPKKPFYQSTLMMPLDVIKEEAYFDFADKFFKAASLKLDREVFARLYARFRGITWYMQTILWSLYAAHEGVTTFEQVEAVIEDRVKANEYDRQQVVSLLPDGAQRLAKAIAKEGRVKAPQAGDFINKYALRAASSVKSALDILIDKEIVYPGTEGYEIYDFFLAEYLKKLA